LKWVSPVGNIETSVDIAPHGGEQYLEVIFSDEPKNATPSPHKVDCGIENVCVVVVGLKRQ
jgi:hypothetical protein